MSKLDHTLVDYLGRLDILLKEMFIDGAASLEFFSDESVNVNIVCVTAKDTKRIRLFKLDSIDNIELAIRDSELRTIIGKAVETYNLLGV